MHKNKEGMRMTCGVYEIKNLETNQSYIGRSINIENRWIGHKSSPTNNMAPTIELYESNPEMVEWNIICEIDETHFDKEELKFITSVCELYEINQRGGWESDNLINGRDGDILACPPSILSKREYLPKCVDIEDLLYGIEKWANDVYRHHSEFRMGIYTKPFEDENNAIYWHKQYYEIKEKYEELVKREQPPSFLEQQKAHSLQYRAKMESDYEYYRLRKENDILTDENEELKSKVSFWKEKCITWRERYHNLLERVNVKKHEEKPKKAETPSKDLELAELLTFSDLIR